MSAVAFGGPHAGHRRAPTRSPPLACRPKGALTHRRPRVQTLHPQQLPVRADAAQHRLHRRRRGRLRQDRRLRQPPGAHTLLPLRPPPACAATRPPPAGLPPRGCSLTTPPPNPNPTRPFPPPGPGDLPDEGPLRLGAPRSRARSPHARGRLLHQGRRLLDAHKRAALCARAPFAPPMLHAAYMRLHAARMRPHAACTAHAACSPPCLPPA